MKDNWRQTSYKLQQINRKRFQKYIVDIKMNINNEYIVTYCVSKRAGTATAGCHHGDKCLRSRTSG